MARGETLDSEEGRAAHSPAQIKAYRIADNQTADLAEWNYQRLLKELAGLKELEFDLEKLGFSADDLNRMLHDNPLSGLTDPDAIPGLGKMPPGKRVGEANDGYGHLVGIPQVVTGFSEVG